MDERQKIKEELNELNAQRLQDFQGKVPEWEMPAAYLDNLADRALEQATPMVAKQRRLYIMRWAVAAVLVLAAGLWWMNTNEQQGQAQLVEVDWNAISTEDLQQYVSDNIEEFDLDMLASTGTDAIPESEGQLPGDADDISTEALENYLEADDQWLDDLESEDWF